MQHLQTSLDQLLMSTPCEEGTSSSDRQQHIESMASFIYASMSASARNYHHVQHVFDVVETNMQGCPLDAIAVLAVLFHDCVYAHVDEGGLSDAQREKLHGAVEEVVENGSVRLRIPLPTPKGDCLLAMVQRIFGIPQHQGDKVQYLDPHNGQNEYLSAVIAVRALSEVKGVTAVTLVQIAACIETTIPFRTPDAFELLYTRMRDVSQAFELPMTDNDCIQTVQRATLVANEDVGGFAFSDHQLFIDRTWSLLPETNAALRRPSYSIFEFHAAVHKMHQFFLHGLNPQRIFHQFRGVPSTERLAQLTQAAEENVRIGTHYVAAKLIGVAFLSSFAVLTGGDAPIQLFMGTTSSTDNATIGGGKRQSLSLADRLESPKKRLKVVEATDTEKESSSATDTSSTDTSNSKTQWSDPEEAEVYKLLTEGRHAETTFDLRKSPLSTYFYTVIGDVQIRHILELVGDTYPMTCDKAKAFLTQLPRASVRTVANLMADVATERREAILQVVRDVCGQ